MVRNALIATILFISGATPVLAEVNWANTLAVIIGNADYGREDVPDLPFASNDVRAMEEFVRDGLGVPDSNIKVLRNAGLNEFRGVFGKGRWLDTEVQRTRANVLVYISSHGVPDKNQNAYFVPSNADPSFPEDLYPRTEVVAALERARRFQEGRDRRVVAIFDSCFSGGSSNGALTPGKTGLPSMDIQQDDEDVTIFSAVSNSGIAYPDEDAQLSALTSAFLQGWAGEADNPVDGGNGDTQVSLLELSDFVQRSVPVLSKRNQQPDIKPGQSFSITPFALASLRPQLAAKEAQRRWEELDLSALNASVLGLGVEDLRPRRGYLRQLNGEVRRLQGWCRKQPKNACSRFAANLTKVPLQIRQQRQRLEDQLAWKNAEDRQTFKIDCDAYKRACAQLQARMPGYSCLHEADLQWECPSDDVPLLETARSNGTAESWQAYLDGCVTCADEEEANLAIATLKDQTAWKRALSLNTVSAFRSYADSCVGPCTHKDDALKQIAAFELAARQERLRREDDAAWNKVRNATVPSTIQSTYLNKCNELCRHKQEANARIEALEEKVRIARLRNEDEAAWKKAVAADTIIGFRRYIETCKGQCKHKQEALKKIDILKEKVRIAKLTREDDAAWDRVSFSKFPNRIQQQYLDQCNEVCAHKSEAEAAIAKLETADNRRQRDLRDADERFWQTTAEGSKNASNYRVYLNGCNEICAHKDEANQKIKEIVQQNHEKADRERLIEEDKKAWQQVKFAGRAEIVRERYVDICNSICAFKTEAYKKINKLNTYENERLGQLSLSAQTRMLQRLLNKYACDAGSVDGVLANGTKGAYRRFAKLNEVHTPNVTKSNIRFILSDLTVWNPRDYKRCDGKKDVSSSRSDTDQPFRDCSSCPLMAKIPAGTFTMGSELDADNAKPAHKVRISQDFAIGVYEVTFDEWKACVDDLYCARRTAPNDYSWGKFKRPVVAVSWDDINAAGKGGFVAWLNSKVSGSPYRLPSEAEWEYAARAGTTSRYYWGYDYPRCAAAGEKSAVHKTCSPKGTRKVGHSAPNLFGLYDVHGNVGEWVQDCWFSSHKYTPNDGHARSKQGCKYRVVRGGSWAHDRLGITSSSREGKPSAIRSSQIGFRIARDL